MAKSKGNVIAPDAMVGRYGADTVRLYSLFLGPPERDAEWFDGGVEGSNRFLRHLWRVAAESAAELPPGIPAAVAADGPGAELVRRTHATIDTVTRDIGDRFAFNTAESAIHELVNALRATPEASPEQRRFAVATAVSLVQPYAPHIACELWERLGGERLWDVPWPTADPAMLVSDRITYAVQVNGKLRGEFDVPADVDRDRILADARAVPNVARHLDGATVVKEIVVPGKLVSLVTR
jgi:leucyl-tRNA synthetase